MHYWVIKKVKTDATVQVTDYLIHWDEEDSTAYFVVASIRWFGGTWICLCISSFKNRIGCASCHMLSYKGRTPMFTTVTNVNQALSEALHWMLSQGVEEPSRNGPVVALPEPAMITYTNPEQRVLFSPKRDANPFFHLMEALWMLGGRNGLAFPLYFNSQFDRFSDDGVTLWGAYGYRWRCWFGYDQLSVIAQELKRNPQSRRCVLEMWDASVFTSDLSRAVNGGKDVPCNTHAYFDCRDGQLNMTVCNRSNDLLWGAFGANAVHFSVLLEYLAEMVGMPIGHYRQFTNNLHVYTDVCPRETWHELATDAENHDFYSLGNANHYPLIHTNVETWDKDLAEFLAGRRENFADPFFRDVAKPMYEAWVDRKTKQGDGLRLVEKIAAPDWRIACSTWIKRRETRKQVGA